MRAAAGDLRPPRLRRAEVRLSRPGGAGGGHGGLSPDGQRMKLRFSRQHYRVHYAGGFWGLESCRRVEPTGTRPVTLVLEQMPRPGSGTKK